MMTKLASLAKYGDTFRFLIEDLVDILATVCVRQQRPNEKLIKNKSEKKMLKNI